ncbi:MAG: prenyltransferase [Candidatus Promineifilaceae bacterium]|nr:prenyltransferase [Candidatus Promineifilaceae bacterium]
MDFAMWLKALRVIPRISEAQWRSLDIVAKWLIATRSAVLIITFIPAVIAGLLALRADQFDFGLWIILTIGLILAHATNNLVNDLTDSWKGVDSGDDAFRAQYGPQPIEHGLMSARQVLLYAAVTGLVALACGLYLAFTRGGLTWLFLGLGVFFVLLYTWPLKHIGLGEVAVLIVWGPLMVGGGYYVITGQWDWNVAIASLPYALGAATVIFGKHIDKLPGDRAKGVRTLPVLLGERNARYTAIGLMAAQYLSVLYLVLIGYFTPVMLVVFLAVFRGFLPIAARFRQPRPTERPADWPEEGWPLYFVALGFYHNRLFGLLFIVGLVADVILANTLLA